MNNMMTVKYACCLCFHENDIMESMNNDKIDDKYIYHAYTFFLLYSPCSGNKKLGTTFPQKEQNDEDHTWTLEDILHLKPLCQVKATLNFNFYYFNMARLLLGLYDYRLKHIDILEEIHINPSTMRKSNT